MAYEQKDNTGSLFKNDRKEKDTHADARGSAMIGGVDYWLDAWTNTDKNGNRYQAIKFKPKEARAPNAGPPTRGIDKRDDMDDSIPF